jgi:hypothetical protein
MEGWMDRQTDKQTDRQKDRQTDRLTDWWTKNRCIDKTNRKTNRKIDRQLQLQNKGHITGVFPHHCGIQQKKKTAQTFEKRKLFFTFFRNILDSLLSPVYENKSLKLFVLKEKSKSW